MKQRIDAIAQDAETRGWKLSLIKKDSQAQRNKQSLRRQIAEQIGRKRRHQKEQE